MVLTWKEKWFVFVVGEEKYDGFWLELEGWVIWGLVILSWKVWGFNVENWFEEFNAFKGVFWIIIEMNKILED